MNLYPLRSYLSFWLSGQTIYDVHSPSLYAFLNFVLDKKRIYYDFIDLDRRHYQLSKDNSQVLVSEKGAGSKIFNNSTTISKIVKHTASPKSVSRQLYRMNLFLSAHNCLELGACIGLNSMYLAKSCTGMLTTIEGHKEYSDYALKLFERAGVSNIKLMNGLFLKCMEQLEENSYDLIFIDGDHSYQSSLELIKKCKQLLRPNGVIVLSDIYWSKEMTNAWREIIPDPYFPVTIDIFHSGFLLGPGWKIHKKHLSFVSQHWSKPWKYLHGI